MERLRLKDKLQEAIMQPEFLREVINIKVKPNAPKTQIVESNPAKNLLIIKIKACPEHGKANIELLKFLARYTGKKARIISGFTKREKLVEIY